MLTSAISGFVFVYNYWFSISTSIFIFQFAKTIVLGMATVIISPKHVYVMPSGCKISSFSMS
jgi:hypothetical protein